MKNSTLSTFYKKPGRKQSDMRVWLIGEEKRVHDSPWTMIGIEECESDGYVVSELDYSRGMKRKCSLGQLLMRSSFTHV